MEAVERRRQSRRQRRNVHGIKEKRCSHFQTVHFGGFEEGQVLCYLWDIVKSLEPVRDTDMMANQREKLEKQLRRRIRVEMKRYFARHKRRNAVLAVWILCAVLCLGWLFGYQIGIDRVSGISMYPYLNNGDWIVYSRTGKELHRDDVVVFEKNGEFMVKRVAGIPGDRVEINRTGSQVRVNGEPVREEYITLTEQREENSGDGYGKMLTVMNGQYLVLGDNRAESMDSRDSNVGTVPLEDVRGRVILVVRVGR